MDTWHFPLHATFSGSQSPRIDGSRVPHLIAHLHVADTNKDTASHKLMGDLHTGIKRKRPLISSTAMAEQSRCRIVKTWVQQYAVSGHRQGKEEKNWGRSVLRCLALACSLHILGCFESGVIVGPNEEGQMWIVETPIVGISPRQQRIEQVEARHVDKKVLSLALPWAS